MKKRLIAAILGMMILATTLCGCGEMDTIMTSDLKDWVTQSVELPSAKPEVSISWDYNEPCEGLAYEIDGFASTNSGYVTKDYLMLPGDLRIDVDFNTEEYKALEENGFKKVMLSPLSTFSADVDTASYANVRRYINWGYNLEDIPKGAVRTEEMINYFHYNYELPKAGEPFGVAAELGVCPWNEDNKLLSVGIRTEAIDFSDAAPSNIVFLIDVSGSMDEANKLPLLVNSYKVMLENLSEKDRVSIVTYAGEDRVVLEGVPASEKEVIERALDGLMAGGGTNGGQGIISAYNLAEKNFIKNGNNRVILATDGDLNIGITNESDLKDLIKKEAKTGVFLTVLGFGMGNYSDTNLETLADCGNGNYAYIDTLSEAKKVLCEELGANMVTVAKDVKFQVEFNPAVVAEYRLIGYEDRLMQDEDFEDDTKDAGEIGAGHCVTALYEIVTVDKYQGSDKGLKYQETKLAEEALNSDEWMTISIRYKEPNEDTSKLLSYPVGKNVYRDHNSQDFLFAANVAEFAQILRGEEFVKGATLNDVVRQNANLDLNDEYKREFDTLVRKLRGWE